MTSSEVAIWLQESSGEDSLSLFAQSLGTDLSNDYNHSLFPPILVNKSLCNGPL